MAYVPAVLTITIQSLFPANAPTIAFHVPAVLTRKGSVQRTQTKVSWHVAKATSLFGLEEVLAYSKRLVFCIGNFAPRPGVQHDSIRFARHRHPQPLTNRLAGFQAIEIVPGLPAIKNARRSPTGP